MCLQKHAIYGVLWIVNAQKTMLFAMFVTSTRSLKCTVNTAVFFTCMTSSSQSKPAKNTGIHKKQDVFNQFCAFSARAPQSKNQSFWLRCWPLSSGLKKVLHQKTGKLHLTLTFCLLQSLPHSSNSKRCGRLSGPKKCCKLDYNVLWTYHAFYLQNKWPPPAAKVRVPLKRRAIGPTGTGGFYTAICSPSCTYILDSPSCTAHLAAQPILHIYLTQISCTSFSTAHLATQPILQGSPSWTARFAAQPILPPSTARLHQGQIVTDITRDKSWQTSPGTNRDRHHPGQIVTDFTRDKSWQTSPGTNRNRLHPGQTVTDITRDKSWQTSPETNRNRHHQGQIVTDFTRDKSWQTSPGTNGNRLHPGQIVTSPGRNRCRLHPGQVKDSPIPMFSPAASPVLRSPSIRNRDRSRSRSSSSSKQ